MRDEGMCQNTLNALKRVYDAGAWFHDPEIYRSFSDLRAKLTEQYGQKCAIPEAVAKGTPEDTARDCWKATAPHQLDASGGPERNARMLAFLRCIAPRN